MSFENNKRFQSHLVCSFSVQVWRGGRVVKALDCWFNVLCTRGFESHPRRTSNSYWIFFFIIKFFFLDYVTRKIQIWSFWLKSNRGSLFIFDSCPTGDEVKRGTKLQQDLIYNVDYEGSSLLHLAIDSGVLKVTKNCAE